MENASNIENINTNENLNFIYNDTRVKIFVKTPYEEEVIELNDPSKGLYIGPMIWREMFDF